MVAGTTQQALVVGQDWAACESVQRGLASRHFRPGPYAPHEDAVARFAGMVAQAYAEGGCPL